MNENLSQILQQYRATQRCMVGFNINDIYDLQAVVLAANEVNEPILVMTYPPVVELNSLPLCRKMVDGFTYIAKQKVYLHLDHSQSVDQCKAAIDAGYDSVMIDASHLSLKENIIATREVKNYAQSAGVNVESEIGRIMGRDVAVQSEDDYLATVADVIALSEEAGPDIIAVGIGTAHGFTPTAPKIHFDRLHEIAAAVPNPLVLHGGTGIADQDIQRAIGMGIAKINIGTIVHTIYMRKIYEEIAKSGDSAYPPYIMKQVIPQVAEVALDRMRAVCSENI